MTLINPPAGGKNIGNKPGSPSSPSDPSNPSNPSNPDSLQSPRQARVTNYNKYELKHYFPARYIYIYCFFFVICNALS